MVGEDPGDQFFTTVGQADTDETSVTGFASSEYEPAFLEVVDDRGDVAAALENSAGDITLMLRPFVIEQFQDRELRNRQVLVLKVSGRITRNRFSSAYQFDICAHGAKFFIRAFRRQGQLL